MSSFTDDDMTGLPEVRVPPRLLEKTLRRLEDEGLVEPDAGDVPWGLYEATLERLEREGLVEPRGGARRQWPRRLRWAAAILVVCGAGSGGYLLRAHTERPQVVTVERLVEV